MNQRDLNFAAAASLYDRMLPDDEQLPEGDCPKCGEGTTNFHIGEDPDGKFYDPLTCDDCNRREEEGDDETDALDAAIASVKPITTHGDHDRTWVEAKLREMGVPPRPAVTIERNFPALIINLLDGYKYLSRYDLAIICRKVRKQAELAILQIDRHNEGKPFDSVSVMAAYEAGEGRIK